MALTRQCNRANTNALFRNRTMAKKDSVVVTYFRGLNANNGSGLNNHIFCSNGIRVTCRELCIRRSFVLLLDTKEISFILWNIHSLMYTINYTHNIRKTIGFANGKWIVCRTWVRDLSYLHQTNLMKPLSSWHIYLMVSNKSFCWNIIREA